MIVEVVLFYMMNDVRSRLWKPRNRSHDEDKYRCRSVLIFLHYLQGQAIGNSFTAERL